MNIAMIEPVSSHGGMNYYDYGLMKGLSSLGSRVILYTSSDLKFDISNDKNLTVSLCYKGIFSNSNKLKRFLKYIKGTFYALHDAKKKGYQVIHYQIFAITILEIVVVWLTKCFHFPLIVTVHDVESFDKNNSSIGVKYFYNNVDRIIVHNQVCYQSLSKYLEGLKNLKSILSRCSVIHHGSYIGQLPNKINKVVAKQKFGITEDCFTFLFFGQIKRVKGLDVLLDAFVKLLKSTDKKVKLIVAGKVWKDCFEIYEKTIKDNNISEYLILEIRYIKDEEIVDYYSAADCVVLPYKKIFQSGVLLMAQSYQIPVLASDLEGMTEIINDKDNGFIFKSENSDDLCKKMKECMECKTLNDIVTRAYKKLQSEYDWTNIAKEQFCIMNSILEI